MAKPSTDTYPAYFTNYISLVPEDDLLSAFENQESAFSYLSGFTELQADKSYATGKWTLKELLQHMIDTERIFTYRALAIARGEQISLPGFDENEYSTNSFANERSWESLCQEMEAVRRSASFLFHTFNKEQLMRSGKANNNETTVLAIGFITVGHAYHHLDIIRKRYELVI